MLSVWGFWGRSLTRSLLSINLAQRYAGSTDHGATMPMTEESSRAGRKSEAVSHGPLQVYPASWVSPSDANHGERGNEGRGMARGSRDQHGQGDSSDVRLVAVVRITRIVVTVRDS